MLATNRLSGKRIEVRIGVHQGDVVVEIPTWNRNYVSKGGGSMNLGEAIPAGRR